MSVIEFPISRESACCSIYIYSGSSHVGLKSIDELRKQYLSRYEKEYRDGLAKRRKRQLATENAVVTQVHENTSGSDFLQMVANMQPSAVSETEYEEDFEDPEGYFEGAEGDYEDEFVTPSTPDDLLGNDWVSHGVSLFDDEEADIPVKEETVGVSWDNTDDAPLDDGTEDEDSEFEFPYTDDGDEFEDSFDNGSKSDSVADDSEEDFETDEGDFNFEFPVSDNDGTGIRRSKFGREERGARSERRPTMRRNREDFERRFDGSERKKPEKPVISSEPEKPVVVQEPIGARVSRLDDNVIRDYVKAHKMCTEKDIVDAFSYMGVSKVRSAIESAKRHSKIFKKHDRFTV